MKIRKKKDHIKDFKMYRIPRDKKERLIAALNSKDEECFEDNGRIIVWGKNLDGENIYLGDIDIECLYQKGVNVRAMIERVRFGR